MLLCLREPPVRFLWCYCSSFHFWSSFRCSSSFCRCSSFIFSFRLHPSPFRELSPGFYTHFILSVQSFAECSRHFHFQPFRYLLAASATASIGHFLPTDVFYLTLLPWHFNLRLSRSLWEPAVLPWSLPGFMLILETQTRPICLFDSQSSIIFIFRTIQF